MHPEPLNKKKPKKNPPPLNNPVSGLDYSKAAIAELNISITVT